jgi:hypothetical protein
MVKNMLINKPHERIKCYTFSLNDEELANTKNTGKNLSPLRKKFDDIERRGQIRKMRERIGYPYERPVDIPRRKKFY